MTAVLLATDRALVPPSLGMNMMRVEPRTRTYMTRSKSPSIMTNSPFFKDTGACWPGGETEERALGADCSKPFEAIGTKVTKPAETCNVVEVEGHASAKCSSVVNTGVVKLAQGVCNDAADGGKVTFNCENVDIEHEYRSWSAAADRGLASPALGALALAALAVLA